MRIAVLLALLLPAASLFAAPEMRYPDISRDSIVSYMRAICGLRRAPEAVPAV